MSGLKPDERRRPQDGRIPRTMPDGRKIDLRVSCLPTSFGESVVLRVLDRQAITLDLNVLGFPDEMDCSINTCFSLSIILGSKLSILKEIGFEAAICIAIFFPILSKIF